MIHNINFIINLICKQVHLQQAQVSRILFNKVFNNICYFDYQKGSFLFSEYKVTTNQLSKEPPNTMSSSYPEIIIDSVRLRWPKYEVTNAPFEGNLNEYKNTDTCFAILIKKKHFLRSYIFSHTHMCN